jgi:hypothetical protein
VEELPLVVETEPKGYSSGSLEGWRRAMKRSSPIDGSAVVSVAMKMVESPDLTTM